MDFDTLGLKALAALRHDGIEFVNARSDFCVYVTSWPKKQSRMREY